MLFKEKGNSYQYILIMRSFVTQAIIACATFNSVTNSLSVTQVIVSQPVGAIVGGVGGVIGGVVPVGGVY